jgi:hypothetical protein
MEGQVVYIMAAMLFGLKGVMANGDSSSLCGIKS